MLRLAVLLLLAGLPAQAQPVVLSGNVGLSLDDRGAGAAFGDLTGSLRLAPNLSFDLGLFGRPLSRQHETYATLTWGSPVGRLSAGIPRPAYDLFAVSLLDRMMPHAAGRVGQVAATRSRLTWGTFQSGDVQVGVAYRADAGWAVSAHRVLDSDRVVGSTGAGIRLGAWDVAAAVEIASDGEPGAKLTVAYDFGEFGAQAGAFRRAESELRDMIEAGLTWQITPRIEFGALTQVRTGDGDNRLAALAATVSLPRGQVNLGLIVDDGDPVASLAYGLKF